LIKLCLKKIKHILLQALPAILIVTLLVVAVIYAWTEPSGAPPTGNVSAPINVGDIGQYKTGALRVGGLSVDYGANLATLGGNVGIGTRKFRKLCLKW